MRDLVLALDQGTTGTTALLVDRGLRVLAKHSVTFPNRFPAPGLVEHDPADIWRSVGNAVTGVWDRCPGARSRLAAIGITNQRETSLVWDRSTGDPLHAALVWQDRRTAETCRRLREQGHEPDITAATGLVLDPYFSATKIAWILDNVPGARARAERGSLAFGTIDSWLTHRLTGEHVTDLSNASRTLLLDLHAGAWSEALCGLFDVPPSVLPTLVDSSGIVGSTRGVAFLPDGVPVAGLIGDQQGALFGQACFEAGSAKCTYGTGAFVLANVGQRPPTPERGLLGTVAWRIGGMTTYALEGSVFVAGSAVQWLRDGLGIIETASDVEALAASVPDTGGVTFLPALTGLGAPVWNPHARGTLTGLTRGTTAAHIARATLDGIALQIDALLDAMQHDVGERMRELRVDGGAAANDLLMQRQADLSGLACVRPRVIETTAVGSALLAGLGAGVWRDQADIRDAWEEERRFEPRGDLAAVAATKAAYQETVKASCTMAPGD